MSNDALIPVKSGDESGSNEIDFFSLIGILWRRKWLIMLCGLLAAMLGGYSAFFVAVPRYSSQAELILQLHRPNVVDIDSVVSGVSTDAAAINTELQVIRSRGLIKKLVLELKLHEDPEFNASLRPEPAFSIQKILGELRSRLSALSSTDAPPAEQAAPKRDSTDPLGINGVVSSVRRSITTSNQRNTYIFFIRAKTENPRKSALLVNTLARLYIEDQIDVKFQATENAVAWLSDRVVELASELEAKEEDVTAMRAQMELSSPEALEILSQQARDLRRRLNDTRTEIDRLTLQQETLSGFQDSGDLRAMAEALQDPTLTRLLPRALNAEAERELFMTRVDTLVGQLGTRLQRAQQQSQTLASSMQQSDADVAQFSDQLIVLQQAERDVEATRTLHETFLVRLKETSVQRGLQQADARLLSEATSGSYVEPNKSRILVMSALMGSFAGAALVLAGQLVQSGFRRSSELEAATGLTTFGQLPRMPIRKREDLLPYLQANPTSASAEAVRNLRTSLMLSNIDNPPQVIMITSSMPGEGKTTQAISMAYHLARLEKRVLLIEGDLRRRTFQTYFPLDSGGLGLLAAMDPASDLSQVLYRSEELGFDVLPGENTHANAADIFSSVKFRTMIDRLRGQYDHIIIDVPPVLVVPDARVLGQVVDAILFTVAWNRTSRQVVNDALRQLASANLQVTGTVLSQIDPKGQARYGYETYGNYYGQS